MDSATTQDYPFAFKASVDTIAYMSCSGGATQATPSLFSFKAMALNGGSGLALGDSIYATGDDASGRAQLINQSVGGTRLELAIRQPNVGGGYTVVFSNQGEVPILGEDFGPFLEQLDGPGANSPALSQLAALPQGTWLNHISDNSANLAYGSTQMQSAISIMTDDTNADGARTALTGGISRASLALTFTQSADINDGSVRSPTNPVNSAYGTGYVLDFRQPQFPGDATRTRLLNAVHSVDLATGAAGSDSWVCNIHLLITRPGEGPCPVQNTTDAVSQLVGQVLSNSGWYIYVQGPNGVDNERVGCIMPTSGVDQCYGPTVSSVTYSSGNCNESLHTCPHWLTICQRQ